MKNVQDVYSLSPMQQGLLFHALSDSANGAYVERISWTLSGALDVDAYRSAWEHVIKNHPILCTSFHFEDLDEPVQVVHEQVKLPWQQHDWRALPADEQEQRFTDLLTEERRRGFKLNRAPLMRLTLLHVEPKLYRFLWSYHHLLLDGWSISLVLREVVEAYEALRNSQSPPRTASRPYRDYIGWLQGQDVTRAETFWREKLRAFTVPTILGVERRTRVEVRPADRYRKLHRVLPPDTTAALQSLARRHQLTLNPVVQAAWALLLSRYSGDEEVLFGTVVSGRPTALEGAETMVGLFINTLPMRVRLRADQFLLEWLKDLQAQQLELQQYEYSPLRQVQRWSEVRNGKPLFDSVVVVRNLPLDESLRQRGAATEVRDLLHHEMATGHPLTFGVVFEQGLRLQLTYDSEKYEEETIQRMLDHVDHLLEEIATNPDRRLAELTVLTAGEQEYLSETVNATGRKFRVDLAVHELFAEQAGRCAEATALTIGELEISYGELNERSNGLAQQLVERGVGGGEIVAVCLERSLESVIALLGIWKAGAAYLPLEVEQPAARLQLMLQDAAPALLITSAELGQRLGLEQTLAGVAREVLCLERKGELLPGDKGDLGIRVEPSALAYVIYTSGSTGQPKGVLVEHGQLLNALQAAQELYRFSAQDVVACVAPFAFDISMFELLTPLLAGGRVVLVSAREMLEEETAAAVLGQVTYLHSAPGLMRQMVAFIAGQPAGKHQQVRAAMVGGDAVSPELLSELRAALPQARLYVGYGPTEAAIMCAAYEVNGAGVEHRMLGYPMANTAMRLYDQGGQLVPLGVVGEVYIGGANVSRGYLNSAELTAEKFVELGGERWYRSGDLGRRLSDGSIAFAGRADGQVKVRGYRIEVGEVEAALESQATVRAAAVAVKPDARGEGRLVAYVVLEAGAALETATLRRHVAERLPEYMVPLVIVELQQLPLTPLAKVDRNALPEPGSPQELEQDYVEPRTIIEEMVAGIWAETLRIERVGVLDNFFEAGGDSLLATQLMSRVREAFAVEVPLRQLFEQPTVGELGLAVEAALRSGAGVMAPPIVAVSREQNLPLSFAQQRLWFFDQLQPNSAVYNMPFALRLRGQLQVEALEQSLTEIVRRHEVLRTTFRAVAGEAVQVVHAAEPFALTVTDLSGMGEGEGEQQAQAAVQAEARRAFDLSGGPLLRVRLLRLSAAEHVVLFTMHHIISDGWSLGVLVRELVTLYEGYLEGRGSALAELRVQYGDYAVWQREWLQGEVLAAQVEYWREQLRGAPAVLELPTDKARPAVQTHRGGQHAFSLSAELTRELRELSGSESGSLFMTLLAGWQLLLGRYAGQEEVVVGTPIANRHRAEVEPLIGFFVNTLALRTRLEEGLSFRGLLRQVKETALGAYAHQDLPFEKLVEELQPERSLSHTPLFQVFFALQNAPVSELKLTGLELQPLRHSGEERSLFDLSLSIGEVDEQLRCGLGYNRDLYEAATMERLGGHYERLLWAAVKSPERAVSELEMLSAAEREQLQGWSRSEREYEQGELVPEMFAAQAAGQPEAVALVAGERALSYAELDGAANRLAQVLIAGGVSAEVRVGVCLERGVEAVVALLAIWKAGGVYLPLDPQQPGARLEFMLADAQPRIVIVRGGLPEGVGAGEAQVLCLEEWQERIASQPEAAVAVAVRAEQLAYVIYTSGSTGEPKGVEVEHGQLRNTLQGAQEIYQFSGADVVPCFAPLTFDISLFEVLTPLLAGARLVLVDSREVLQPEVTASVLEQATFMHAVPGLMRHFASVAEQQPDSGGYRQLRGLFVGGDVVSPELVRQVGKVFPFTQLTIGYGPTEATIMCASYQVKAAEVVAHQLVGRAMGNVSLRLLDRHRQEVPVGVVGEIYIGGAGVARGYLNRAELTAERFVEVAGERYYRSGDLGRWLGNGLIEFVGRADEQVKVRGYRIEVGEVEAALSSHAGVKQAVVVARADGSGEKRLVAYFVSEAEPAATVAELREHLRGRLPEYMVPSVYVQLEEIPLTALAKVDRRALPAPEQGGALRGVEYLGPRTAVEEVLVGIWSEVLKVERVGVRDNFFELGGHSLLATQLMSRVREAFAVEVPLRQLFEQPTVGELGLAVEAALRSGAGVMAPPIVAVSREQNLPLSFAQQRLWFFDQLQPESTIYNMPNAIRMLGELKVEALEQTLTEIVRRHEVLRTKFTIVQGEPVQTINSAELVKLQLIDLSLVNESEREEKTRQLITEESLRPFDLSRGPLLRVGVLKLAKDEHITLFTMHHIVSDGWSMEVLIREVAALYTAFINSEPSPLAELSVQYADFAAWQRAWLQGEVLAAQIVYWKQQLEGASAVLELPTDHPRPHIQSHHGARLPIRLSSALKRSLEELSRREGVTLFMTLLGAWQTLLMRYSGQQDIVVGIPVANRNYKETEALIGFFVNMLAIRTDLSGDPSFSALLARVRETALGAYAHQDLPFEKLVEELQPVRSMSHPPLFQVVFVLERMQAGALQLPGLQLSPLEWKEDTAKFDLSLAMAETTEGLGGILEYNTDIFERETIERMGGHFLNLLASLVADPEQRLSELMVLTAGEQEYLSETVNATGRKFRVDLAVHELFAEQAGRCAEATALTIGELEISYGELNERSNGLAQQLVERGVGGGEIVAVCLERSLESVIALLGIWKAGAAYLPLEVEQPAARLQLMLQDAAPALLITSAELGQRLGLEQTLAGVAREVLCLERKGELLPGDKGDLGIRVEPSALAYVIYTSGSTGQPKGVLVEHGQLLNALQAAQELYRFSAQDVVACVAPFAFDISMFELLTPLLAGGRVVLVSAREMLEEETAAAVLGQVTYLHSAPGLMRQMVAFIAGQPAGKHQQVRAAMVGGDAVSPELLSELRAALPQARLYVGYGPTEAAIMCAAYEVNGAGVEHRMLGYPMANTAMRLYDQGGQLVPLGVVGEVYIGGANVSRGYLNSAELTAEKFVELGGERWYRSGDLGRRLSDGSIAFAGRADGQVKVRGYRIEVGEVEAALESQATVRAAAVAVKPDARGEGRLVAYVVLEAGAALETATLRRHVAERLPEYMVPLVIVELQQLPLTPLAKVDRNALPELEQVSGEREYEAPRTVAEKVLCEIFGEVLKVEGVGIRDSFFELGGHSLLATQLMSRVRETLQVEVALRELFEHSTVAALAVRVEEALRSGAGVSMLPIEHVERNGELVLSFAQQRLWFFDQLQPESTIYNMVNPVRLTGQLNVSAMEATLSEIVRRHEMLRTTFTAVDGQPMQVIHAPQPLSLSMIDLTHLSGEQRTAEVQRLVAKEIQQPFDLTQGPLLRTILIKVAEEEHVVLFTMHHIISDGWSMGVLSREVAALYTAFVNSEPSPLAELPVQYADFAAWQREWLQGEVLASELDYWRKALSDTPAVLELPLDHPRPRLQSHRGTRTSFALSRELTESLRELSRHEGVTLFMTLLSVWQILLMRYSGQEDIVVGTTIANRNRRETESLIGFFVNTLAMRTNMSGDPGFRELLGHVREMALGAYAHQDLPFEKLVEELQPARSLSHSPIFQVMFGLENVPREAMQLPGLELTPVEQRGDTTLFDLSLGFVETAEGLEGILEYNTDLFECETIERMAKHFQRLLESVVADPQQRLSELTMLSAAEQLYLMETVNESKRSFNLAAPTHVLFEQQVSRFGDSTALSFGKLNFSYAELNERANRLAHLLIHRGIGSGDMVAVCLERTPESVISLLAIWKAGAAYLPLDIEQPRHRLRLILEDAGPALLLITEELRQRLALEEKSDREVLCLDGEQELLSRQPNSDPACAVGPDDLAYVLYTSGSTGEPKGVEVEHKQLINALAGAQESLGFGPDDVMPYMAPLTFDISLLELLCPLVSGGRVVLVEGRDVLENEAAARLLDEVTFLQAVPVLMRHFVAVAGRSTKPGGYAQMRGLLVGGDVVSPELVAGMREAFPAAHINIGYGPTEATIMCASYQVKAAEVVAHQLVGRAMGNVSLRLLDRHRQEVPVGVVGEIYIGGAGVARGYLNRAELTAERFVEVAGERYYRSGDLGRRLGNGLIEFVGRADEQVKVRGYRIELGEVEAALAEHSGVREAVVVAREEGGGGSRRLVAYVVGEEEREQPTAEGLREHLRGRLPEYMVPSVFVVLERLPLTPNGKVNRRALPAPEEGGALRGVEYLGPRTAVEEVLVGIWSEVLKVERVGVRDNFFELGGHSLLATQLMSRVREAFAVEVPLRQLFEQPTVGELGLAVEAALRSGAGVTAPPIVAVSREQNLPLSFAQQRLWFFDQLQPNSAVYNMPFALRLRGQLQVEALEQSLTEIVRRHEVLRTTFRAVAGEAVQVVHAAEPFALTVTDLSGMGEGEGEQQAQAAVQAEARRAFDLSGGPLLRVRLLRLSAAEHVVLFTMHHIISDGWSLGVLVRELVTLYEGYLEGRGSALAELRVQYGDYAVWQREWLQGEVLAAQVEYWREQLRGAPAVLELPTDKARPAVQTHRGGQHAFSLSAELTRELRELSGSESGSLFMTLLAGWQLLLGRYAGQEEVVVGTPIANRHRAEVEPLIGFFVNTLALRTRLEEGLSFRGLLRQVKETALGAYAHQDLPFEKLVEELQPERSLSHTPLFQVFFALQNAPVSELKLTGLELQPLRHSGEERSLFDLSLSIGEVDEQLRCGLGYNRDLYEAATMERLGGHYERLLWAAVKSPERAVSELEMLSAAEREQLQGWSRSEREYEQGGLVPEMFAAQAAGQPEAVALVAGERALSYAELDGAANRLAQVLIAGGVSAEVRVGVCLERGVEAVVALLAIWKAGGVYLPLDPQQPGARLEFMLADAQPRIVIVRGGLPEGVGAGEAQVLCLEEWQERIASQPEAAVAVAVGAEQLAYVIYTSGSTGEPKGVEVEHGQLRNTLQGAQEIYQFSGADVVPCFAPLTFDISLFEVLTPLLAGARLVLVEARQALETAAIEELLEEITFWHSAPGLMRRLLEVAGRGGEKGASGKWGQVRGLFVGGDVISPELVAGMRESFPEAAVWVGYGPTEATIMCASYQVKAAEVVAHQLVGRAMGNVSLRLLDRHRQEVPVGVVGEIYIGGAGVARGYLNRAELTAERFVEVAGERYYRSGDLGRWLGNGLIEFVGRADEQVKVRGYRIEVGEVEAALSSHAGVKQAVVVARADGSGEKRLVAYFVSEEEREQPTAEGLREHLRGRLPEYMVPSVYVQLEEIPLTALAKVDRRALPAPEQGGALRGAEYLGPRTAVEEVLVGIWSEVLKVERVGVRDNFFELGGHSLLATQLMSRVREAFAVEVPLRQLFEQPTVGELGLAVEAALRSGAGVMAPPIVAVSREQNLPLSFAQQRLWFFDQLQPNSAVYNMPFALRLRGQLQVEALEQSLTEIVRRHEVLRTTFRAVAGEAVQVVHAAEPFALTVTDLSGMGEGEGEQQAQAAVQAEARRAFDLSGGPLLRVRLLRLSAAEHVVLFTMHHIISDGWSLGVLVRELVTLYEGYLEGRGSALAELRVQYGDYAVWQREWLQGEVLAAQVEYWREQLRGAPAVLELPTDKARPAVQTHRGGQHAFSLSAELTRELRELSGSESGSLFMTLLAGWQLLLGRYAGQEEVVVGTPIANRHRAEVEPLIGFFVNTLALRTRLEEGLSFRGLLRQVKETALGAYAHQDLPFEKLVEELQPERSLSHTPLFQVFFALQNAPVSELKLTGLELQPLRHSGEERSLFDLSLSIGEVDEQLRCGLGYNRDLYEAATMERLGGHYERLLWAAVKSPERAVSELEMLSAAEREQLQGWSRSEREYEQGELVPEMFAAQAAGQPEAVALVAGERALSYAELDGAANRLAQVLIAGGVSAEVRVGVCLERGVEAVVALLAIWKAGGVYLPLDPQQPGARLEFMLADAQPRIVIVRGGLPEGVGAGEAQVLCLEEWQERIASQPEAAVAVAVGAEQLAYVIYTSGSTGEPKGVEVEHGQLRNTLQGAQEIYQFSGADVVPCFAPLTFDISLFEVLTPLLAGARLVLVEARQALETAAIEELLEEITFWHSAPGLMRRLLEVAGRGGEKGASGKWGQVRGLFVGGDVISPELVAGMRESFPEAAVWVGYGPTEATIMCASYQVKAAEVVAHQLVGRAMGNVSLRLLDRHRQEVPVGVVGEIYIGGAGVARGYLNRAELTAERFVEVAGERYYRSGDLGRWLGNGLIEFVGRADEQVKVRGYRIEVGEVEAALSSHAGVKQAVVVARADGSGEKRLVAYFVSEAEPAATVAELREHLRGRLPEYMVPSVYVQLEEIPLTALAKVDRRALPAPEQGGALRGVEYLGPRTAVEEVLVGIWSEVLKVERVGVRDNFFELGGHSLLATQLMSRVREAFAVEVPLRQLFEQPTVGELGLAVEAALRSGAGVTAPPIVAVSREQNLPLSFAQQRLWFFDQLQPESTIYNMVIPLRLTGQLNVSAMEATLSEIVRRHEMLRTTFTAVDGQPVQVIHAPQPLSLSMIDLTHLSGEQRTAEVQRLVAKEIQQPFDLTQGPLLRTILIKVAEEEHVVLWKVHHIVSDGWSMGVFIREFAALYTAFVNSEPSPLAELPVQYADFAAWQREWLQGEVLASELDYWRKALSDTPAVLELPLDHPRPRLQSHRGTRTSFALSRELTESLRELSRHEGVTLFMTLLSVWQILLMRYSGQEDIVVGTSIANRNRREIESLIGFFVNTLAMRTNMSGDPGFRELLGHVREMALGAYAHQDLPFEKLVEELQPARSLSHSPIFQVMFGLENVPREAMQLPGLQLSMVDEKRAETTLFDLSLGMAENAGTLQGILDYNTDLFECETIERMAKHFQRLLESVVADPQQRLSELTMLSAAEQLYLMETVNESKRSFNLAAPTHVLFEQQVSRFGDSIALSFGKLDFSYAELNERANRLAHLLIHRGIGSGDMVAVCLERTPESVISLLAIWKAGAAYLPLDIEQPRHRLRLILEDAGPALLLITEELRQRLALEEKSDREVLCLDGEQELLSQQPNSDPACAVGPDDLAYVLYTSGSSGTPKGVLVEHGQILNTLLAAQELYQFTAQDVAPCLSSVAFDISLLELLSPLLAGGRVLLLNVREMLDPKVALDVLSQITFLHAVPATMKQIAGLISTHLGVSNNQLRTLMVGGDVVSPELVAELLAAMPQARVYVCYGPTEAAIFCAAYEVSKERKVEHQMLGYPIANAALRLYDRHGHLVPVGVGGEVYIGGPSVSRGYLNSAELMAEKFVELEGERWYRSGDLGRRLNDGSIAFLGRADDQVKVRGYRIEVGEVEAALLSHATVRAAAVAVKPGPRGEGRLIGYVVTEEGAAFGAEELRRYVGERLPSYMVPVIVVALELLPLTPLGKIDRKALPEVEQVRREYEAPRTAVEEVLCDIWGELLKLERVGIRESFFELGGHSLLATQLMSRVRDAFTIELPLRSLFEKPTIAELAIAIEEILITEINSLGDDEAGDMAGVEVR